jgi:hypothetical protein
VKLAPLVLILGACTFVSARASAQDAPASGAESGAVAPEQSAPPPPPPNYAPAPAPAVQEGSIRDASDKRRPFTLSVLAYVPWWYGIGIGARVGFEIPIVHNGFIPSINDSFSLEPSFAIAYSTYNQFSYYDDLHALRYTPALAVLWSFYFSPKFRVYGAVNLGYTIVDYTGDLGGYEFKSDDYFYYEVSAGIFYDFNQHLSVRAELGWQGLRGGLALLF